MTIAAEIALGLASSIIYDGVKRPYKAFIDTKHRRKAIAAALLDDTSDSGVNDKSRQAIADLTIVLANVTGEYTDLVNSFFGELQRSGIPDAIRHYVLCGRDPLCLSGAFCRLFEAFPGLPFDGLKLFNALVAGIRSRVTAAIADPVMLEAMQVLSSEIAQQLDAVQLSLAAAGSAPLGLPMTRLGELRAKLAKAIEVNSRHLNVETTQGTKKIPISKLVIPARLAVVDDHLVVDSSRRAEETLPFLTFRRTFHRAVIMGDPGGGKSTLTQSLCFSHAHQITLEAGATAHKAFDVRDLRMPLKVILRSLDRRQQNQPAYSIFDYLVDEIHSSIDIDRAESAIFLRYILDFGQSIILFDGLDEILNIESRRNMAAYIEAFSDSHALCSVLITSRIVGYRDAPLSPEFQRYTLAKFNTDEVNRFSEKLISAIDSEKSKNAKDLAEIFVSQTEVIAGDLRQNPLLLGLMVYIYLIKGDIPNNRPEIYKECSLLMFEKWDQRRDIIFQFPGDFDLLDLFGFIASKTFGAAETEDGVDAEWLLSHLREFFEIWYDDKAKAIAAARVLMDFITGRAWVMCEIGPNVYKFTHRTFLEYFFARRIEEESGSVKELIDNGIYSKIINAEWDVVSHLSLQIATFRSALKSIQAVDAFDALFDRGDRTRPQESNFMIFVSKALEYLTIPESRIKSIASKIAYRCIDLAANQDIGATDIINLLILVTRKRSNIVRDEILGVITPLLSGENDARRRASLYFLRSASDVRHGVWPSFWRGRGSEFIDEQFASILEDQCDSLYERAHHNLEDAKLYLWLYRNKWSELYELHGFDLFESEPTPLAPVEIPVLLHLAVMDAIAPSVVPPVHRSRGSTDGPRLSAPASKALVERIASEIVQGLHSKRRWSSPRLEDQGLSAAYLDELLHALMAIHHRGRSLPPIWSSCLVIAVFLAEVQSAGQSTRLRSPRLGTRLNRLSNGVFERIINEFDSSSIEPEKVGWLQAHIQRPKIGSEKEV